MDKNNPFFSRIPLILFFIQGIYTFVTACWALVDIQSFMVVTGPKTDIWLVKTVALLLLALSLGYLAAWYRKSISLPLVIINLSSAAGLVFIDFYYPFNDIISSVYMLDGVVQVIFLSIWLYLIVARKVTFS